MAQEITATTIKAAEHICLFGIPPKVALFSASNFGSREFDSSAKMREAVNLIWEMAPDLGVDGEMHGDVALSNLLRDRVMPKSKLSGEANLLVFPSAVWGKAR